MGRQLSKKQIYKSNDKKKQAKLRNEFEELTRKGLPKSFEYEGRTFDYVLKRKYFPDFVDEKKKIIVEAKQQFFNGDDRRKMRTVAAAHPEWKIVMVFGTPDATINKTSKTTYKMWAEKQGFTVCTLDELPTILDI